MAVGESSVEEIERYNILQATGFAMQRAVSGIVICPDEVWVDGDFVPEIALSRQGHCRRRWRNCGDYGGVHFGQDASGRADAPAG